MNDDLMSLAVRDLGVVFENLSRPDDARSGAGVHRASTSDGQAVYVKLTPASLGTGMLNRARHELNFYRQIAGQVPVRTPAFIGALDTDAGIALLLRAAGEQMAVEAWTDRAWASLGRELARLHSVPVPAAENPAEDWLIKALSEPVPDHVTEFWRNVLPELPDLLATRDAMRAELAHQPLAFIHGDCHTGNIVHGANGLVFCDWQSAGPGRPTADLAHLSVRATPAGVTIPVTMKAAYANVRGADVADLERMLIPAELAVFIFQWPPYAAYNSPTGVERVRNRTRLLATKWLHGYGATAPSA